MSRGQFRANSALLATLPTATLAVGYMLAGFGIPNTTAATPGLNLAALVAAVSPLLATLVLRPIVPGGDLLIVGIAGMLVAIGTTALLILASAQGAVGTFYTAIATRHGLFVGAGYIALVCAAIAARRIDVVQRFPFTILAIALGLTLATMVFGETVNGARLWLHAGPVRFQPSELSRLLIATFAAIVLHDRRNLVVTPWRMGVVDLPPAPYLLPLAGGVTGAVAILAFQNDLGMAALLVFGTLIFVSGVLGSRQFLAIALVLLAGAIAAAYATVPRLRDRVAGWLDPWTDPAATGFQLVQGEYGLATGGLVGRGSPAQARNVPEIHTDLIVAGVGDQLGWLVAVALLGLAALLVCRCLRCALTAVDGFKALLALCLSALLVIQIVLIVGGALRVLPLTGLTFPLVSFGGTSMIVTLFSLGLIVGVGAEHSAQS